jgi:flavin-dependent dehydrogenase
MQAPEPHRRERADVAVIGGGPAGSATAIRLARSGLHVLHLERRVFGASENDHFRSGEGIPPSTLSALQRLDAGIDPGTWTLAQATRVRLRWPSGNVTTQCLPAGRPIRTLDRESFDASLWQASARAGNDCRDGWHVTRLLLDERRVIGIVARSPDGELVTVDTALVVDAGGRNAPSLMQLGLRRMERSPDFMVVVLFFDDVPELRPDTWEMHFFTSSAPAVVQGAWLTEGVTRFGLGTHLQLKQGSGLTPERFFWQQVAACPELEARLRAGRTIRPAYARARLGYRVARPTQDGLLLVGDATGYLSPILGDGIYLALRSAEVAAAGVAAAFQHGHCAPQPIHASQQRWQRERQIRLWIGRALILGFQHPALLDTLGKQRRLQHLLLARLTRP